MALILAGVGFDRGERVRFARSRKLRRGKDGIQVAVRAPSRVEMPITVESAPRILGILWPETADGQANEWVKLTTTF